MKVLLFGGGGYLGRAIHARYADALTPRVDIADRRAVAEILDQVKPDVVINAAGKTGTPNVDWCEEHKRETVRSNVEGPVILLEELGKRSIYWVHMSSGCIYAGDNGGRGFDEEDPPNFFGSFYSFTKAASDQMLKNFPVLTLRLRMPFDATSEPRNLITKLTKYDRVLDEKNSLTYLPDFLDALDRLIKGKKTGIFNVVNDGAMSPYHVMELYREIVDPAHVFERLTLDHLPDVVKAGRSNCILSSEKLKKEGIVLPAIDDRMREALRALKR